MKVNTMRATTLSLSLSFFLFFAGCGGGGGGLPDGETGTVSGTITHAGNPVAEGTTATFIQVGGTGIIGVGVTDGEGKYTLSMKDGQDILVGKYSVGVTPPAGATQMTPEEIMEKGESAEVAKPPYDEKYLNPESSKLMKEVTAGENTIDIVLE